ncbi:glycoside hydrolase family 2 TIM barrel-domain containing protein [Nakamurella sp. A5-74]|uniref:Glycoside hydrolase family 2 TIM barrel-domain containing protein n=1 Tax=Nakamurella sp. A5-74 TaxID=3158264 RepID=A0AAU8DSP3_9ACTN
MPIPRPEYPRPDFDRSYRWLSLNGTWEFSPTGGEPTSIVVPFAWETAASTVRRTWLEQAAYHRVVVAPSEWRDRRILLHFGAVHHRATVYLDGELVGTHTGGYTSFSFDVTDVLRLGAPAELTVEVDAPADKRFIPHGKQRSIPRNDFDGCSFTPSSGIWQSVWLESPGRTYIRSASIRGDSLTGFDITGVLTGDAPAEAVVFAQVDGHIIALTADRAGHFAGRIELDQPRLWSPDDPHLYTVQFTVGEGAAADRVLATAGLRHIETRGEQLYLNGQRLYIRGVLDQGYWPETGITAPDEQALVRDLELAREFGFNLSRKHIKFEEPRWLHHADRLGMLVWAEPPGPSRYTPASAAAVEAMIPEMVERDGNHPSIIVWGLYNEEWGLDWDIPGSHERAAAAAHAYDTLHQLDDTRPIVENSGWAHIKTDLVDWHYYDVDPQKWANNLTALASGEAESFEVLLGPDFAVDKSLYGNDTFPRSGVPILNSEFGAGFTSLERAWHIRWQTQEMRRHDRFAGYVYTELTDVEHEMAGIVDADRRPKDLGGLDPATTNADTVIIMDVIPAAAGADIPVPTGPLELDIRISHHGPTPLSGVLCAAWGPAGSPLPPREADKSAPLPHPVRPFQVSGPIQVVVPAPSGPARLHIWLQDSNTRTFLDAGVIEPPNRRGGRPTPR